RLVCGDVVARHDVAFVGAGYAAAVVVVDGVLENLGRDRAEVPGGEPALHQDLGLDLAPERIEVRIGGHRAAHGADQLAPQVLVEPHVAHDVRDVLRHVNRLEPGGVERGDVRLDGAPGLDVHGM